MPGFPDFFHCNVCFTTPPSSTRFRLTNCRHILCDGCFSKTRTGEPSAESGRCGRCQKECIAKPITADGLPAKALKLFLPIEKTMADQAARLSRVHKFQEAQMLSLASHVNKMHGRLAELSKSNQEKAEINNKLENELKSTQISMQFFEDQLKQAKARELERTSNHNQSRTKDPNAAGTADDLFFMDSTESTGNVGFSLSSPGFPASLADISTDLDSSAASSNAMSFTSIVNSCAKVFSFPQAQSLPPRSAPRSASRPATAYSSSGAEQQTFDGGSVTRATTSNADFSPFATQTKHSSVASSKKWPVIASGLTTPGILGSYKIQKRPRPYMPRSAGALHGRSPLAAPPSQHREETADNPYLQMWKQRTAKPNVGMSGGGSNTGGGRGRFTPTAGAGNGNFTLRSQTSQMRPVSHVPTRRITPLAFSPANFNRDSP